MNKAIRYDIKGKKYIIRLKKRMMQTEEELFKEGGTVEEILARI